jgi:D-sedoheptulose 7-phosphate isomerase
VTTVDCVFLDRDGVLNAMVYDPDFGTVDSPSRPDQVRLLGGVEAAVRALNESGRPVVVVSNQPGIAKGKLSLRRLAAVNEEIEAQLRSGGARVEAFYCCPHHPKGHVLDYAVACECRKPGTGLLRRAARDLGANLSRSVMVGDGITDVAAGAAAGARTIFVGDLKPYVGAAFEAAGVWPNAIAPDLTAATGIILSTGGNVGTDSNGFVRTYLGNAVRALAAIDIDAVERLAQQVVELKRRGGRLFVVGNGGGAAHASHAVNDFRKLAGIEAYTPTDNVAELTARVNDDGWDGSYAEWLRTSRLGPDDLLLVFSVGGGDAERGLSGNLMEAVRLAKSTGTPICGIVGPDGGLTRRLAEVCVTTPPVDPSAVTPHTEGIQSVLAHLLIAHPDIAVRRPTWEDRVPSTGGR